jgi:hypothetical protein
MSRQVIYMRRCILLTYLLLCALLLFHALSVSAQACEKYNRKEYRHWIDEDRDCRNTRHEVLIEESLKPVGFKTGKGCKVASGRWLGSFTGRTFSSPKKLDIDHLVPLKEAHDSGAYAWSKSKKRDYANDMSHPDHLIAVASGANRSKGAKDPAEWMPPDKSYWREYARAWTGTKLRWGLSADARELAVLRSILGDEAQLPQEAPERICTGAKSSTLPASTVTQSFQCGSKRYCKQMESCEEARFHLNECGRKNLDRDKDGVPCEKLCK